LLKKKRKRKKKKRELGHSNSNKETNFDKIDGAVEALGEIAGQFGKKD
jgi:hypothetical protein